MKKALLVIATVFLLSCSGDDSSSTNRNIEFNPPSWIQGTWKFNEQLMFKFTDDDFCTLSNGGMSEICNKETLNSPSSQGFNPDLNEAISDTQYSLTMTYSGNSVSYSFEKVSDTSIRWNNDAAGNPIFNKVE